ncbi:hypothetical protein E4653_12410 [Corynebacterium diphtheriae subsp. lausannense]|nr:hypothetical protein E4653_12410 [Corynebacterium diphtheriae subsp. lausannense]
MMIDRITWMFRIRMVITGLVTFIVLFYALVTKSWIWWLVVVFTAITIAEEGVRCFVCEALIQKEFH